MGLAYSISYGIAAGFIFYTIMKVIKGKTNEISIALWVVDIFIHSQLRHFSNHLKDIF